MELAIDVKYNEIIDFLKSRQKTNDSWAQTLKAVRGCVEKAAFDLPNSDEFSGVKSPNFTYADCKQVFEALKAADGDGLNMLRQYKSPRVQTWYKLLRLYQRDCVHIAEFGTIINHNTTYEIPALKKESKRLSSLIDEVTKRISEQNRKSRDFHDAYLKTCTDLGINGEDVGAELGQLAVQLDGVFDFALKQISSPPFQQALKYYVSVVNFIHEVSEEKAIARLELLSLLSSGEILNVGQLLNRFGLTISVKPAATTSSVATPASPPSIDWGSDDEDVEDVPQAGDSPVIVGLSDTEEETDEPVPPQALSSQEASSSGSPLSVVALLAETLSQDKSLLEQTNVLDPLAVRNQLITELLELTAFLKQRLVQLKTSDEVSVSLQASLGDSSSSTSALESIASSVLDRLTAPRTQQLILIKTSPKYVERLTQTLNQKRDLSKRMAASAQSSQLKLSETQIALAAIGPQLSALIQATKGLKTFAESELSSAFQNRQFHLVGAVNEI